MATMFPRTLRETDCKSAAEVAVFEALQAQLTDERLAFHSVSWLVRNPGAGAEDGEVDFVLVHPDKAVVCLEVKGGKLASRHGRWKRYRHGEWEDARDPSAQALDHRYAVERLIDGVEGWRGKDLLIVHAVAFPDVTVESAMAPDGPREILIDSNDMRALEDAIDRVLAFHIGAREKRKPPGQDGVAMLRELFAKDVELRVPLVQTFRAEHDELVRLTSEQAVLLARLGRNRRMRVTGCAGSGKTMLAVEQARRWATRDGRKVLFVCFNKRLRKHRRARDEERNQLLDVPRPVHAPRQKGEGGAIGLPHGRGAAAVLRRGVAERARRRDGCRRATVRRAGRRRGAGPSDALADGAHEHARG